VASHDPRVVAAADRRLTLDQGRLTDHVEPVHGIRRARAW
jgi:hypothetical protein